MNPSPSPVRVALAGFGSIGRELGQALMSSVPGYELTAVAVTHPQRAREALRDIGSAAHVCELEELADYCDIAVECAPGHLLRRVAVPVLEQSKELVVLSAAALLANLDLIDLAKRHGGRITVPSGALPGVDAIGAASEGHIKSVRLTTKKPATSFAPATAAGSDADLPPASLQPRQIFSGTAREAAAEFPQNLNIAVTLALAGFGADATTVEVWADPGVTRNIHEIEMVADSATLTMRIENVPGSNPRTARMAALSVIHLLRKRQQTLVVGT